MIDDRDWLRLGRYFAGEGTDDERRETEGWIAAVPARAELVRRLRTGWERAVELGEPFDVERAWGEVARRKTVRSVSEPVRKSVVPQDQRPLLLQIGPSHGRRWWPMTIAASVFLALASGVVWQANLPRSRAVAETGPMRAITTPRGQMAEVYLSDGTHVRLGAASTLRFPTTFGGVRQVYLEGEGYFDVVHDPTREFAVHTAQAVARDIGTRFNVRAYPGSSSTEVVVAEGAVALQSVAAAIPVRTGSDSIVLIQADLGRVDAAGMLTMTRRVNVDAYLAWMHGRLMFADTPLREALPQLSRWYDVDVTVGDSALTDIRLTATLEVESLPDALQRLSALLDARIERHGRTVVLYAKHHVR